MAKIEIKTKYGIGDKVYLIKSYYKTCPKCKGDGWIPTNQKGLYKKCECGGESILAYKVLEDKTYSVAFAGNRTLTMDHCILKDSIKYLLYSNKGFFVEKDLFKSREEAEARVKELQENE